jgi:hypothetical protein
MPPATANPSTAAITGFDSRNRLGPIGAIESWPPSSRFFVGIARRHRLEVGARAKIAAGAGEHGDRCCFIGIERKEGVVQLPRGRAVNGVATMRAVDGNDGHGTIAFDEHGVGFGHGALLVAFLTRILASDGWPKQSRSRRRRRHTVIASEAKQSMLQQAELWIVSLRSQWRS